ncbi:MAG TPA: hypothetical protein PLV68_15025, partial [Ilumatobacteraceae bacterium]|nr:hypothetical protein [Ilumatobacteraceae bacterium]
GRLHGEGRRGDVIITGGENVWPDPVQAAIAAHPAVADVAVAGVPDPEWGQAVAAWIVVRDGHTLPTVAELRALVTQTLPAFAVPKVVRRAATLPRTALGKLRRHELTATAHHH